ncbi:pulmonary surfactant-associated protein D-like [Myotis daubentonii]|uniref:pulmonary surfactant-associated protein D-like n=1 Tax=Myotis daubentonii TaxID=98922 RepID=UPI002872ED00|nr:pulmonary surfactant-associated protein D-like [Myotis daubentonii]
MAMLLFSVLFLLTQPSRSWGAEVKSLSKKPLIDDCTLVMCNPVEKGLPGRDGRHGKKGPRGEKGDPGSPGAPGPMGMPGPAGPVGPKGDNGSAEEPGPKGDSGPRGPLGPSGVPGVAGAAGLSGMQGNVGPQGEPGPKGEPRPQGEVGASGVQGSAGTRGPPGFRGENGAPGERGAPGIAGPAGPAGRSDPQGPTGTRGPPGLKWYRGASRERREKGERGLPDNADLRRQVKALQGLVGRLLGAFLQYKKVELFPHGQDVGQKVFKSAGFLKTFYEAWQVCAQAGGQLPSPRSAAENHALQLLLEAEDKGAAFLSMTDFKKKGWFTYPGGKPLVYSNWNPGEPNNDGGKEHCVEMYTTGKWNDKVCGVKRLVICEF